ncbi:hypothetical protein NQ317_002446 [Molorchus minor]|uniref:Uncharacterized protein n=1 Tax=Molorchus minor TaxID=1323400 RepID=A0ABQ9J907_9CUCU|nr:hypothetical protein NQ317_002446 [Molorchus minor]
MLKLFKRRIDHSDLDLIILAIAASGHVLSHLEIKDKEPLIGFISENVKNGSNITTPQWNATTPSWNVTTPSWNITTPSWNATPPSWNITTPNLNITTPGWNELLQGVH